jgi:hypothetical protein
MFSEQRQFLGARPLVGCFVAIGLATLAGCSSLGLPKSLPWPLAEDEAPKTPAQVVAVWADAVQHQANQPPTRGFGGRLMFYDVKGEKPVKVDGTLAVYAFDEANRDPNNAKPDRKFVFLPEQLPSHYSKSQIGHSYSVWLPWDKAGGLRKDITLIVRFLPKKGAPLVGDPVRQVLPGEAPPRSPAMACAAPAVQPSAVVAAVAAMPVGEPQPQMLPCAMMAPQAMAPADASPLLQRHMATATIPIRSGLALGESPSPAQAFPMVQTMPSQGGVPVGAPTLAGGWYPPPTTAAMTMAQAAPPTLGLPPRSRYTPVRSRPLGEPVARLTRDRAPTPPAPAGRPSGPALPPGSAPGYESAVPPPAAVPTGY